MQAASRTPNSILRRRPDKENEDMAGKAAKRNKLANRRVSFAPDDELETKHIFKEDDRRSSGDLATTSPIGGNIALAVGAPSSMPPANLQPQIGPPPVLSRLNELSPLSMDLTNDSDIQPKDLTAPVAEAANALVPHYENGPNQLQRPQRSHQHPDYTRNITKHLPNLSALVEEDEGQYAGEDVTSGGTNAAAFESTQPSPFVLREMQQRSAGGGADPPSPLWNYAPGVEDTMDVRIGDAGMGQTTYLHVYGSSTMGDVTKAIRDGENGGGDAFGRLPGLTRTLPFARRPPSQPELTSPSAPGGKADVAELARNTAAAGPGADGGAETAAAASALPSSAPFPPPEPLAALAAPTALPQSLQPMLSAQPQPVLEPLRPHPSLGPTPLGLQPPAPAAGMLDNTTRLLDDDQTDAWRLGPVHGSAYNRGRLSVASNKVLPSGYRRAAVGGLGLGGLGETTTLLGAHTQQLGMDTAGPATMQLLAETATQSAYNRLLGRAEPQLPQPSVAQQANRRGAHRGLGDPTAAYSTAGDAQQRFSQHEETADMSLDLDTGRGGGATNGLLAGGGGSELLGDHGGLTLDAFAVPPEPTINLVTGMPGGSGTAQGRAPAPSITCQDFLSMLDVSFNEKVCRTSYLPQSDPPPKTVMEIFEASAVTVCHMDVRQANMIEVSGKLSAMQSHVQELEAQLTKHNPKLFAEVQLAGPAELERIKDQVLQLKKVCRSHTVQSIKETELAALDEVLAQLEQSKGKLQAELAAMTAEVERVNKCAADKEALVAAIARRAKQDDEQLQEAIQRKKNAENLFQRLQELKAQNKERERRLAEARAERQAAEQARVPMEQLQKERAALESRLTSLMARNPSSALTPGREGQLARQVALKRDEVEATLGLLGLQMDASTMDSTRTYTLVFLNAFNLAVRTVDDTCEITVTLREGMVERGKLKQSVLGMIGNTATALSSTVPRSQLPSQLDVILQRLHRAATVAKQLVTCFMENSTMQQPEVDLKGFKGSPALVLGFLNTKKSTKVTIRLPWNAVLFSDITVPPLKVELRSLEPLEVRKQNCELLQTTVLSRLEPGVRYLHALCSTLNATVE